MVGCLFPTGNKQDWLEVDPTALLPALAPFKIRATLIDAANPFVMVSAASVAELLKSDDMPETKHALVETIRCQAAVAMGLASSTRAAGLTRGTPKIALLSPPKRSPDSKTPDIFVQSYSMGLPHPSFQLTGAVCLGSAVSIQGTIAAELSAQVEGPPTPERTPSPVSEEGRDMSSKRQVLIEHGKGTIPVLVEKKGDDEIASCAVSRTARRLFEGRVIYYL